MAHQPSLIQSSLRADRRGPLLEALDLRPQPRGARILLRRLRLAPSSPGRSRTARDAQPWGGVGREGGDAGAQGRAGCDELAFPRLIAGA
jgi:hypothetical protein